MSFSLFLICLVFQGKSLISKRLPAVVQSCWASNNSPRMRTLSSSSLSSDWSRSQIPWPGQQTKSHACPRDWIFTSVSTCYLLVSVFKTVRHGLLIFGKFSNVFQKRKMIFSSPLLSVRTVSNCRQIKWCQNQKISSHNHS